MFDFALVDSNPSKFPHYYFYALCNMATFHAPRRLDLTIMVDNSRTIDIFEHSLCIIIIFSQIFYVYLKMFRMILIILSQVLWTKFLQPPRKGNNGWLVVVVITLLVITWLIIIKKPSLQHELHLMWSRLWSKNSKLTTFSFNILMFLYPLFSLNCLIPLQVKTWHLFLRWWNYPKVLFNLMFFYCQSHPPLWDI